jgi:hypothetical protein
VNARRSLTKAAGTPVGGVIWRLIATVADLRPSALHAEAAQGEKGKRLALVLAHVFASALARMLTC